MKLGDLCHAPCFPTASAFEVPAPGCGSEHLKFASELNRDYYAVLLRNHDIARTPGLNPRVAVVGLSPAGNQIKEFVSAYRNSRDYAMASIAGAFAGLARDIIAMIKGLGIADKLGLHFPELVIASSASRCLCDLARCLCIIDR